MEPQVAEVPSHSAGVEVADIFRAYGDEYASTHRLSAHQRNVLWSISNCRTEVMGGYVEVCDDCGGLRYGANSCRDRHCPKCQRMDQEEWMALQMAAMLPVEYFHVIFTLPHQLNDLIWFNKAVCYDLLFHTAAETLQEFADRHWGGSFGMSGVLHTWSQVLRRHAHVHFIVPGGVLRHDGQRFIQCPKGFKLPYLELGTTFRGKYIDYLTEAYLRGDLQFPGLLGQYERPDAFLQLMASLPKKRFVAHSETSFSDASAVVKYLSRYTHRVAMSNGRLISFKDGIVTFRYKDNKAGGTLKTCRLRALRFIGRFLSHVLPKGYTRIRHYGFLASGQRYRKITLCRSLLGVAAHAAISAPTTVAERMLSITGRDIRCCPFCAKGHMVPRYRWPPGHAPPERKVLLAGNRRYQDSA